MSGQKTPAVTALNQNNLLAATERAAADLRRGAALVLTGVDQTPLLIVATELLTTATLEALEALGEPKLLLTDKRAAILHIPPTGDEVLSLKWPKWLSIPEVKSIADASEDLDHPMRGPFTREKRPSLLTEKAAIRLAKIAGLLPSLAATSLSEVDPHAWAAEAGLLTLDAQEALDYPLKTAATLHRVAEARVPTEEAEESRVVAFRPQDGTLEHLAIIVGEPNPSQPVLVRLHSSCLTGDVMGSLKCDCGPQLRGALALMAKEGAGMVLYLNQEGRGIGLMNKLRAYRLQDQGFDTIDANERLGFEADERIFEPAAEMLRQLGYSQVRLLTNNPEKVKNLIAAGVDVIERVPHAFDPNPHNERYLATKKKRSGHFL